MKKAIKTKPEKRYGVVPIWKIVMDNFVHFGNFLLPSRGVEASAIGTTKLPKADPSSKISMYAYENSDGTATANIKGRDPMKLIYSVTSQIDKAGCWFVAADYQRRGVGKCNFGLHLIIDGKSTAKNRLIKRICNGTLLDGTSCDKLHFRPSTRIIDLTTTRGSYLEIAGYSADRTGILAEFSEIVANWGGEFLSLQAELKNDGGFPGGGVAGFGFRALVFVEDRLQKRQIQTHLEHWAASSLVAPPDLATLYVWDVTPYPPSSKPASRISHPPRIGPAKAAGTAVPHPASALWEYLDRQKGREAISDPAATQANPSDN